jgi:hypothetical protein
VKKERHSVQALVRQLGAFLPGYELDPSQRGNVLRLMGTSTRLLGWVVEAKHRYSNLRAAKPRSHPALVRLGPLSSVPNRKGTVGRG